MHELELKTVEHALDACFVTLVTRILFVLLLACFVSQVLLALWLPAKASARGTGYVFVSYEKTNNIAVLDPGQDYKIIKWIETSQRPRNMKFVDDRRLLYVACGDDEVIDVINVATLKVVRHIPTGRRPEMFVVNRDRKTP
jgi:YVTN family beta-propeller protein